MSGYGLFDQGDELDLTLAGQAESQPSIWDMPSLSTIQGEEPQIPPTPPSMFTPGDVSGFANYGMTPPPLAPMPGIMNIPNAPQPSGPMNFPERDNQSMPSGGQGAPNYAQAQQMPQQMPMQPQPQQQSAPNLSAPSQLPDPMQQIGNLMAMSGATNQNQQKPERKPVEGGLMAYLQSLGV